MTKVVCITGAAGGIGCATANLFLHSGWSVVGVDRLEPVDQLDQAVRFVRADLGDPHAVRQTFNEIARKEKRLDALVNNAAVQLEKKLVETEPEEWDRIMAVNVRAAYLTIKYAHPLLRGGGGCIVNVSSVHAIATSQSMAAYATSKGALVSLTRAAAIEMAADGIRVNAVLPGAVDTKMLHSGLDRGHAGQGSIRQKIDRLAEKHPLRRIGQPEEIARAVLMLADDKQSSFITGQSVVIDGGATAKLSTE